MKCTQCGASVTLEEKFCPYCGALNQSAVKHQADMQHYNRAFEATRKEVLANSEKQTRSHSQLIVLGIVILLNIVVFVCLINGSELSYRWRGWQIDRHADRYLTQLSTMEKEGSYTKMGLYYRRNNLYDAKRKSEIANFDTVCTMADEYERIVQCFYYLRNPEVNTYESQGELLERIANNYVRFEDNLKDKDKPYYEGHFTDAHLAAMMDMEERIHTMLQAYGGLDASDMEKLPETGSQELMILLGRRMGIYE
ncbi:MAG: zinc ribbon domain-containing protein [Eubacteriales bacterium]|nr:zinc ribbon domain-containing protein [Eubacteriales bacterium]